MNFTRSNAAQEVGGDFAAVCQAMAEQATNLVQWAAIAEPHVGITVSVQRMLLEHLSAL